MTQEEPAKEQVLVLHDGDLVDVVRMLAPAKRIREHHRRARITLLCGPDYESLLKHCPYFNAVEPTLSDAAGKNFFERMKAARTSGFDVVYDLGAGDAASKLRGSMRFSKTRWINAAPDPKKPGHPVEQAAARIGEAGLGPAQYRLGEADPPQLDWIDFVAKRSRTVEPAYFGLQGRFALFAPSGDDSPPAQRWPKERWASLAHELLERGVEPTLVGGPSTREIGRYVAHVTPGARDLTGRANLVQLAGLGRRANFAFGEDVPLLHLLVAAGAPSALLHPGETPPLEQAPRGPAPTVMLYAPTLAQISVSEAVQAMRAAGGFADAETAA